MWLERLSRTGLPLIIIATSGIRHEQRQSVRYQTGSLPHFRRYVGFFPTLRVSQGDQLISGGFLLAGRVAPALAAVMFWDLLADLRKPALIKPESLMKLISFSGHVNEFRFVSHAAGPFIRPPMVARTSRTRWDSQC